MFTSNKKVVLTKKQKYRKRKVNRDFKLRNTGLERYGKALVLSTVDPDFTILHMVPHALPRVILSVQQGVIPE